MRPQLYHTYRTPLGHELYVRAVSHQGLWADVTVTEPPSVGKSERNSWSKREWLRNGEFQLKVTIVEPAKEAS